MQYRQLGKTSLQVSVLGFGASPLGDEFGAIDPRDGQRAVDAAIDHGITYFDVAPYYGRTLAETRLGTFLKGKRHQIILATKAGRYDRHLPDGFDFSAEGITRSVEGSLRRLQTDVIDVFQAHDVEFGKREVILHETLPALHRLKEQGKIRYTGITGYPLGFLKSMAEASDVDVVLSYCHYTLLDTTLDAVLRPLARARGIGLINASPLHMGMLTQAGAPPWHPAPRAVQKKTRSAAQWCADRGVDLAALALQFALDYEHAATTLVGMRRPEEVIRNVQAVGTPPDSGLLAAVRTILRPVLDRSWPSGLPENNQGA